MNRERRARVERATKETQVLVELDLDGIGGSRSTPGVPFFDHMLSQLGKHGGFDLTVRAEGDIEIDAHHTVEDTVARARPGAARGARRQGRHPPVRQRLVPLDETLVQAAVDLSGRPYLVHEEPDAMAPLIGSYDTTLTRHIFESMAFSAAICLHVGCSYGRNAHHIVEAQFKAVARALRSALALDPRGRGIPCTKGVL